MQTFSSQSLSSSSHLNHCAKLFFCLRQFRRLPVQIWMRRGNWNQLCDQIRKLQREQPMTSPPMSCPMSVTVLISKASRKSFSTAQITLDSVDSNDAEPAYQNRWSLSGPMQWHDVTGKELESDAASRRSSRGSRAVGEQRGHARHRSRRNEVSFSGKILKFNEKKRENSESQ